MVRLKRFRNSFQIAAFLSVLITSANAGVIPLFNPSSQVTNENSFHLKSATFLANDPFSLKALLLDEMKGDVHSRSGNNAAVAIERADVGYSHHKYGYIGYTFREEIFIDASQDTVELLYLTQNKKELPVGKRYNLSLCIKAYKMQGIVYANNLTLYKSSLWNINVGAGIEGLYATQMQDGYVKGYAVATSKKDYSFAGVSNYNYTHNYLYDLNVNPSTAYGYSTHLSCVITRKNLTLTLLANDLFSELKWKQNPYSEVYLESNNKEYDANGYAKYNPTVWGKEGYMQYKQKLVKKYRLEATYLHKQKFFYGAGSDYVNDFALPFITMGYHFNHYATIDVGYETRFRSFNVVSRYKGYQVGIRTDDLFKPSTLGFSIGISF